MDGRIGPTQAVKQSRRGNFKRPGEEFQEWQAHRRYLYVLTPRLERMGAWTLSRYDVTESPGPLLLTVWGHAPTGQLPSNFASLFPLCLLSLSFRPLSHVAMPPPMLCRPVFSAGIRKAPCSLNKSFFTPTHHLGLRLNRGPAQRPFAQFARANRALGHPYRPPSRYAPVLLREVAGWYLKVAASGFGLALVFLAAPVMYCDCMRRFFGRCVSRRSANTSNVWPFFSSTIENRDAYRADVAVRGQSNARHLRASSPASPVDRQSLRVDIWDRVRCLRRRVREKGRAGCRLRARWGLRALAGE